MKKFLSVILSVILILSAFSVCASGFDELKAEQMLKDGISMRITTRGEGYSSESTVYYKDGKMAMEANVEGIDLKLICKNDTAYLYLLKLPFFHIKQEGLELPDFLSEIKNMEVPEEEFSRTYQETVNGVTYKVDEYLTEDNEIVKYYYIGDELKIIDTSNGDFDNFSATKAEILSTKLDDSVFELPFFSLDISPILEFIMNLFY